MSGSITKSRTESFDSTSPWRWQQSPHAIEIKTEEMARNLRSQTAVKLPKWLGNLRGFVVTVKESPAVPARLP